MRQFTWALVDIDDPVGHSGRDCFVAIKYAKLGDEVCKMKVSRARSDTKLESDIDTSHSMCCKLEAAHFPG